MQEKRYLPAIEAPVKVKQGEAFQIHIAVPDKSILCPQKPEKYLIRWIEVLFQPNDEKFPKDLKIFRFNPPDSSPNLTLDLKIEKPGTIFVSSYCDVHGFLRNSKDIQVDR